MTTAIIITLCILLLLAYFFDLTSSKTRIPSVILLLLLGWGFKHGLSLATITLPDFSPVLPILGTVGLILIVLEGSLDLEVNRSKVATLKKAMTGVLFATIALGAILCSLFYFTGTYSVRDCLINVIPICIISSAIAIPSARNMATHNKEFVVYESSLSDILGVVLFNFVVVNTVFDAASFFSFGLDLIIMTVVSVVATVGLGMLMRTIQSHVKFIPITLLIILIYEFSKLYHLPSLLFILIFGLVIGNLKLLTAMKWIRPSRAEVMAKEVGRFKELIAEATFLIRSLFFLLFGYLLELRDILNTETIGWSAGIVAIILLVRGIQLRMTGMPLSPLVFLAPRGLITVLLFLTIPASSRMPLVNNSLIIQVIILTALVMMGGAISGKGQPTPQLPLPDKVGGG